jgi:hypothetical protein
MIIDNFKSKSIDQYWFGFFYIRPVQSLAKALQSRIKTCIVVKHWLKMNNDQSILKGF